MYRSDGPPDCLTLYTRTRYQEVTDLLIASRSTLEHDTSTNHQPITHTRSSTVINKINVLQDKFRPSAPCLFRAISQAVFGYLIS